VVTSPDVLSDQTAGIVNPFQFNEHALSNVIINAGFAVIRSSLSNGAQVTLIGEALPQQDPIPGPEGPSKRRRVAAVCRRPQYCYMNNPLEGWSKVVSVQLEATKGRRPQGGTEVSYRAPLLLDGPRCSQTIRSNADLLQYMQTQGLAQLQSFQRLKRLVRFDSVFCVCHSPEDLSRNYIECSYGLTGCFGWLHPECVGLGPLSREQILQKAAVVCPRCAAFLRATRNSHLLPPDTILLDRLSSAPEDCSLRDSVLAVNRMTVLESAAPHRKWGPQSRLGAPQQAAGYWIAESEEEEEAGQYWPEEAPAP